MLFRFPNSGGMSLRGVPAFPCLSGQQFFYPFPRLAAYIVSANAFISFHAPVLPLSPYPVRAT
jgi:hypothetical protein